MIRVDECIFQLDVKNEVLSIDINRPYRKRLWEAKTDGYMTDKWMAFDIFVKKYTVILTRARPGQTYPIGSDGNVSEVIGSLAPDSDRKLSVFQGFDRILPISTLSDIRQLPTNRHRIRLNPIGFGKNPTVGLFVLG